VVSFASLLLLNNSAETALHCCADKTTLLMFQDISIPTEQQTQLQTQQQQTQQQNLCNGVVLIFIYRLCSFVI
jgi:hypothetical protein